MKNVGSLFSGIGGLELGFAREGFETKYFIEDNPYCQATLKKNFPNTPIYGDIRKINFKKLERVDIITGGFPCQVISKANKNKEVKMARGNKGRGGKGACGGKRRRDGSGGGAGNRNTNRQPKSKGK